MGRLEYKCDIVGDELIAISEVCFVHYRFVSSKVIMRYVEGFIMPASCIVYLDVKVNSPLP